MSLIKCPECGYEMSGEVGICPNCGYKFAMDNTENLPVRKKKKWKILIIILAAVLLVGAFIAYYYFSPKTVPWCCNHRYSMATCTECMTCYRCGKTQGLPNGHDWKAATCTEPKVCKICSVTEGKENGHTWQPATCTTSEKCTVCKKTGAASLGHNVVDYKCKRCKKTFINNSDVPNILDITNVKYYVNSVGGIDVYMNFKNKSTQKTINYINVDIKFYNRVGDLLKDDISRSDHATLQYTGPLAAGKSSGETYWRACFYNSTFGGTCQITQIEIIYSDGTSLTIEGNAAGYAVKDWRN